MDELPQPEQHKKLCSPIDEKLNQALNYNPHKDKRNNIEEDEQ